jgi:hypothetical protein
MSKQNSPMVFGESPRHVDMSSITATLHPPAARQQALRAEHHVLCSVRLDRESGNKSLSRQLFPCGDSNIHLSLSFMDVVKGN